MCVFAKSKRDKSCPIFSYTHLNHKILFQRVCKKWGLRVIPARCLSRQKCQKKRRKKSFCLVVILHHFSLCLLLYLPSYLHHILTTHYHNPQQNLKISQIFSSHCYIFYYFLDDYYQRKKEKEKESSTSFPSLSPQPARCLGYPQAHGLPCQLPQQSNQTR